ncbi:MAG: glycosyltransferase, partial [Saprospiraceae bacterium]
MKVMLFVPQSYGLYHSLENAFKYLGAEIFPVSYGKHVKSWEKKLDVQVFRLPDKWRQHWESYYFNKINAYYIQEYNRIKPDVIFIYNNEMLLPETVAHFKKKSKIAFFLGDSPFYSPTNRYALSLLFQADAIFSPDTFWMNQLCKMGIKNMHHFLPGIPAKQYYKKQLPESIYNELKSEVLYIGTCYTTTWGYKKARFMSHFTNFDLQIHGDKHWKKWFAFFPDLQTHFHQREGYIATEKMNDMYNATKIIPIDGNPGVLNGIHFRLFEALGAGALPVLEWQDDLAIIFGKNAAIPAAKSYHELNEMARYYINHENSRQDTVDWMKKVVAEKYS